MFYLFSISAYLSFVFLTEQKVTMTVVPLIAPSLAGNWERIALVLGIGGENTGEIDTIKKTYTELTECFFAVFHKWISGCSGKTPKTWGTIKGVLDSLNINFNKNVEQKVNIEHIHWLIQSKTR